MNIAEAFQSAQFLVDGKGQRTAVVLNIQAWQALVEWIDELADSTLAGKALKELAEAGGRPQQAGWLDWDTIREEWGEEEENRSESS